MDHPHASTPVGSLMSLNQLQSALTIRISISVWPWHIHYSNYINWSSKMRLPYAMVGTMTRLLEAHVS